MPIREDAPKRDSIRILVDEELKKIAGGPGEPGPGGGGGGPDPSGDPDGSQGG